MEHLERAWRTDFNVDDAEGRIISGIAVPYGSPSGRIYERGLIFTEDFAPGAFKDSIAKRGDRVKILAHHDDHALPLGRPVKFDERSGGLYLEAKISNTTVGNDVLELVRDGALDGLSVGFRTADEDISWSTDMTHRTVNKAVLDEVSICNFPAYDRARVESVRSAEHDIEREALPDWEAVYRIELLRWEWLNRAA